MGVRNSEGLFCIKGRKGLRFRTIVVFVLVLAILVLLYNRALIGVIPESIPFSFFFMQLINKKIIGKIKSILAVLLI